LLLALAAWFGVFAQSTTLLRGTVTDPQAAVIAGAKVTLSSDATGFSRSSISGTNGEYQFLQLAPGTYRIVVEVTGFTTLTRTDVQLLVNTPTTLDLRMELGKTTETVNVAAEASAINTVDASVGNAFSETQGTGTRAAVRLAPIFNVDAALSKTFYLPWEGKRLQFRAADLRGISGHAGTALDAVRLADGILAGLGGKGRPCGGPGRILHLRVLLFFVGLQTAPVVDLLGSLVL